MNDRTQLSLLIATGVLLAASLLIAVINLGTEITTFWLLFLVQITVAVLVVAVVLAVVGCLFMWVTGEFVSLQKKHAEVMQELQKRTPWFLALVLLVSQAVLAIADKSFHGQELPTVAVTLILILLFFLANEFIVRDQLPLRILGFVLWLAAIMALPLLVWADRGFNTSMVLEQINAFPSSYKIFCALCIPVFLVLPLLFIRRT